jgi:uncharacterized membrane protein affecting hemolysin expression
VSKDHVQVFLDANSIGAAQTHLDQAAQLLEDISHPMAKEVALAASRLLEDGLKRIMPLAELLERLPNE